MILLRFDDCVTMLIDNEQVEHFPILKDLQNQSKQTTEIHLNGVESFLFADLLKFHNLQCIDESMHWLATTMQTKEKGYIRDLFTLNIFLNNENKLKEDCFSKLFSNILTHADDASMITFFGL